MWSFTFHSNYLRQTFLPSNIDPACLSYFYTHFGLWAKRFVHHYQWSCQAWLLIKKKQWSTAHFWRRRRISGGVFVWFSQACWYVKGLTHCVVTALTDLTHWFSYQNSHVYRAVRAPSNHLVNSIFVFICPVHWSVCFHFALCHFLESLFEAYKEKDLVAIQTLIY